MAETFTLDEPAETFTIDVPKRRTAMESLKEGAVGAGETALSMASGAIAAPVGGLVGLTNLPFGRERATEQARAVQEALTYAPRTQVGQQQMGMVSYPFTKLSELATRGGENVLEATGSPGLATQAQVAMEAIPYILSRAARPAARSAMARREAALNAEASRNLVANETLRRAQAEGLQRELDAAEPGRFRTYLGMKHSPPWIADALRRMRDDGIEQAVAIVMAPHWSGMSVGSYRDRVERDVAFTPSTRTVCR